MRMSRVRACTYPPGGACAARTPSAFFSSMRPAQLTLRQPTPRDAAPAPGPARSARDSLAAVAVAGAKLGRAPAPAVSPRDRAAASADCPAAPTRRRRRARARRPARRPPRRGRSRPCPRRCAPRSGGRAGRAPSTRAQSRTARAAASRLPACQNASVISRSTATLRGLGVAGVDEPLGGQRVLAFGHRPLGGDHEALHALGRGVGLGEVHEAHAPRRHRADAVAELHPRPLLHFLVLALGPPRRWK